MSGVITKDEYYDTISAYEVSREQHKRGSGRSYDQECLLKYAFLLKHEQLTAEGTWKGTIYILIEKTSMDLPKERFHTKSFSSSLIQV